MCALMPEHDATHSELATFGEELRREREIRGISRALRARTGLALRCTSQVPASTVEGTKPAVRMATAPTASSPTAPGGAAAPHLAAASDDLLHMTVDVTGGLWITPEADGNTI